MSGWIKLHRKMTEWEWYDDSNCFRVFTHLLLVSNHKPNRWRGHEIGRGQRLTSLGNLASETGLTVSKVRTAITKLESTGEIASKSHAQHTVFTIKNYELYQGDDTALAEESQSNDKAIANESQSSSKALATNKNDNNDLEGKELKNEKEITTLPAKASKTTNPEIQEVFEYWKQVMGKNEASKLTKEREKKIRDRLKEGYTVEQIKLAIYGCSVTPYNMGQNESGKRYDGLELICRSGEHVERYAGNSQPVPMQEFSSVTAGNIETISDWTPYGGDL